MTSIKKMWDKPCEDMFIYLAQNDPSQLCELINSGSLSVSNLSIAAEVIGDSVDKTIAEDILINLLNHNSPLVREGVIYGLQKIGNTTRIRETLLRHCDTNIETNNNIRIIAHEALEYIDAMEF